MKRRVGIILVAFVLFVLICSSIERLFRYGLSNSHPEIINKLQQLFKDTTYYHTVYFGSSRTLYGVDTRQIEHLSGQKVFNAGLEGADIEEIYFAFSSYLAQHIAPKKVILMLDLQSFSTKTTMPIYTLFYASFLKQPNYSNNLTALLGSKAHLWYYLPFTLLSEYSEQYRSEALKGIFLNQEKVIDYYNGYIPLRRNFVSSQKSDSLISNQIDKNKIRTLDSIVGMAKRNNIEIKLIEGVYYKKYTESDSFQEKFKRFEASLNSKFEIEHYITFTDSLYFKDETHLNAEGAEKYSKLLVTM